MCSNFQQVVFEGRVCYKFQGDKKKYKIRQGRKFGLKLLIDFNQERDLTLNPDSNGHERNSTEKNIFQDSQLDEKELRPRKTLLFT